DVLGAALMTAGVTMLVLLTTWGGNQYAWTSPVILGLGVVILLTVAAFIAVELRAPEPVIPIRLFRVKAFAVSTTVSLILGVAMFGTLGFLPLFLQVVTGSSATRSGLALFPMMGGVLVSSILSGNLISRTGRYKVFPVVGMGIAVVGMGLLSTIDAGTDRITVSLFMFVLGAGIGLTMQVMILATQNAVPTSELGSATAAVTFFREIGGSIGIALFGAVFTSGLTRRLGSGGTPRGGLSLSLIHKLPEPQQTKVIVAIAESIGHIFVFAAPVMFGAFVITWFIREVPLKQSTHGVVEHGATVEVVPEMVEIGT
ncbi:MAG TPA: MFS transporter, partial [Acidimicrobiales bacterium]|nr:MFS transporter [Acidimicrobiales bacterium]